MLLVNYIPMKKTPNGKYRRAYWLSDVVRWTIKIFQSVIMIYGLPTWFMDFPIAHMVKYLPVTQETWVRSLSQQDSLEKEMAIHSSFLARESHGQRGLVGYSPWGYKEADMTKWLTDTDHDLYVFSKWIKFCYILHLQSPLHLLFPFYFYLWYEIKKIWRSWRLLPISYCLGPSCDITISVAMEALQKVMQRKYICGICNL